MIRTFSPTIRRKEMDAVLTCMVDERIGPGEMNKRLVQTVKEITGAEGGIAVRSPAIALRYILNALSLPAGSDVMLSALAPEWQYRALISFGFNPVILDVLPETAQVTAEAVMDGARNGGRLLLLHEALGMLPDLESIIAAGIPVIEDISKSFGAVLSDKKAGMWGVYSILGLEESDLVTGGGGAVVIAPARREWIVLKQLAESESAVDILPDLNSALAYIQLKEFARNEQVRQEIYAAFRRSILQGRHSLFNTGADGQFAAYSFPVVLEGGQKEIRQYAARKDIEVLPAFGDSVVALNEGMGELCRNAASLYLRTVLFPMYPRLSSAQAEKISKVLASLP